MKTVLPDVSPVLQKTRQVATWASKLLPTGSVVNVQEGWASDRKALETWLTLGQDGPMVRQIVIPKPLLMVVFHDVAEAVLLKPSSPSANSTLDPVAAPCP